MDGGLGAKAGNEISPFWDPSYSPSVPLVLRAAIELNIFEIIAGSGTNAQLSLSEIASGISPTNNPKSLAVLENILRFLSVTSFLSGSSRLSSSGQLSRERTYSLTEQSRILLGHKTGTPFSAFVMVGTEREILERMYELKDVVLDPERRFGGKEGKNTFQLAQSNPEFGRSFNEAMSVLSFGVMNDVIKTYDGFNQLKELMDVGGGIGTCLTQIITAYPHIRGINFDLPNVIAQAPKHPAINYVEGDMFRSLPRAENIWMKSILHDWGDEMCEKLLNNCWEALPEDGKMIIVEYLMPEDLEGDSQAKDAILLELHLMVMNLAGKERTRTEFDHLAKVSGFADTNYVPLSRGFYVIEFLKKSAKCCDPK